MRTWLLPRLEDPQFVASFVGQLVQVGHSWGMTDLAARETRKIDLNWVARFVDPSHLADPVRTALQVKGISESDREALQLYLDTVEGRVKDAP